MRDKPIRDSNIEYYDYINYVHFEPTGLNHPIRSMCHAHRMVRTCPALQLVDLFICTTKAATINRPDWSLVIVFPDSTRHSMTAGTKVSLHSRDVREYYIGNYRRHCERVCTYTKRVCTFVILSVQEDSSNSTLGRVWGVGFRSFL